MTTPDPTLVTMALVATVAPLVGMERRKGASTAHAVTLDAISVPRGRTTVDAACGRRVAVLWPPVLWAPRRAPGIERCPECVAAVGAKVIPPSKLPRWLRPAEAAS